MKKKVMGLQASSRTLYDVLFAFPQDAKIGYSQPYVGRDAPLGAERTGGGGRISYDP
jgi:hypothetical protein